MYLLKAKYIQKKTEKLTKHTKNHYRKQLTTMHHAQVCLKLFQNRVLTKTVGAGRCIAQCSMPTSPHDDHGVQINY